MKRIKIILTVAAVMVTGVLTTAVPALAQPPFIVFIPPQLDEANPAGATVTCAARPFTLPGSCDVATIQPGPPAGLVCDIPTTVLVIGILTLQAFECREPAAPGPTPPGLTPPGLTPPGLTPPGLTPEQGEQPGAAGAGSGGGAAPITQEGEQESESGEIDQSFDIS